MNTKYCHLKGLQKSFYFTTDSASSCCRAYPVSLITHTVDSLNELWAKEHQLLSDGVEIQSCESCWKDERQGIQSYRNIKHDLDTIEHIDLSLSNACNQMCSYCSPKFSSEWEKSIKDSGTFTNISKTSKLNLSISEPVRASDQWLEQITNYISRRPDNSIRLNLLGGEPLMQMSNLKLFLELSKNKLHSLCITTNLNPPSPKFLHWVLDNFPHSKLSFAISIDSTPDFNHVPRGKFSAKEFNQNLELLKQNKIYYYFIPVISTLSLFNITSFIKWAGNTKIDFYPLNNPSCLSIKLLPTWVREKIINQDCTLPKHVLDVFSYSPEPNRLELFEQLSYLQQYFERIELNPLEISNSLFQEWWEWLQKSSI